MKAVFNLSKVNFWTVFFRNLLFFDFFSALEQKQLGLLEKNFRQGFQNCFLCVQRTIWEILKLMKTIVIFIITSDFKQKIFRTLAKDFLQACQNCILPVLKKFLGKKFLRKVFVAFFKNFYSLSKTFSGVSAKNIRQICRNSIPGVKRNVLRKFFWERNIRIFKYFQELNGRIFDVDWKISGSFVKAATYLSRRTLWMKFFSRKKYFLKVFSDFEQNFFRPFAEKLPAGLSNLHSTSPLEHFGKKFFSERRF